MSESELNPAFRKQRTARRFGKGYERTAESLEGRRKDLKRRDRQCAFNGERCLQNATLTLDLYELDGDGKRKADTVRTVKVCSRHQHIFNGDAYEIVARTRIAAATRPVPGAVFRADYDDRPNG